MWFGNISKLRKLFYKNENGVSLVTAVLITSLLSTLSVVTLSLVISNNRISVNHIGSSQAFWLAESGLERALYWLRNQDPPPGGVAPFTQFNSVSLGSGTYTVVIDPADQNVNTYIKEYLIQSEGQVGTITRNLEISVRMNTFGKYAYLTGSEGYGTIWFTTGDVINGPLHSNDQIAIQGSPSFLGRVSSAASSFLQGSGFNPTFAEGYQLNAPTINFPTQQEIVDNYWAMNDDPPSLIIDARFGRDSRIEFNSDGTITYNVWHWGGPWYNPYRVYDIQNATANLADLNGIIYVQGDVEVEGTVNGEVTVVATDDIKIINDVIYADAGANGQPNPSCDDVLGLMSMQDVEVSNTAANRSDVIIDAAILALNNSFYVEDYSSGSPRGYIHLWGSLSQKVRGAVGTFGYYGQTGYLKDYNYDQRYFDQPPPYFPTTGGYEIFSWREVVQ